MRSELGVSGTVQGERAWSWWEQDFDDRREAVPSHDNLTWYRAGFPSSKSTDMLQLWQGWPV